MLYKEIIEISQREICNCFCKLIAKYQKAIRDTKCPINTSPSSLIFAGLSCHKELFEECLYDFKNKHIKPTGCATLETDIARLKQARIKRMFNGTDKNETLEN